MGSPVHAMYAGSMRRRLFTDTGPRMARRVFAIVVSTYVLFSLLDVVTTVVALGHGGREGNPVAARVFAAFGDAGLLTFKVRVVGAIIAVRVWIPRRIMSLRVATYIAAMFAAVAATVVLHNVQADAGLLQHAHHDRGTSSAPSVAP